MASFEKDSAGMYGQQNMKFSKNEIVTKGKNNHKKGRHCFRWYGRSDICVRQKAEKG